MSAVESVESQRKGVTVISYTVDNPPIRSHHGNFRRALPVHLASHHFCYNDPVSYAAATITVALMTRVQRARFRRHCGKRTHSWRGGAVHSSHRRFSLKCLVSFCSTTPISSGNHLDCLYKLKGFGIPENALPVTSAGELLTSYHIFWLETRRSMERAKRLAKGGPVVGIVGPTATETPSLVESPDKDGFTIKPQLHDPSQPGQNDVLLCRGKAVQDHPGNTLFQEFMDRFMKQFEQGTKSEKMALTQVIVDLVKASGGRFLIKEGSSKGWEEVGFGASARKRVAAAYKTRRKFHNMRQMAPLISSS
jgi:hypothetical protein